jgi:outer membrane protein assembly factor BamB
MQPQVRAVLVSLATLSVGLTAAAENWPSFRAHGGVGKGATPDRWDIAQSSNVAWRTAIPGIALSSPIVWEDRIYLTTAVPQAPPQDQNYRTPHVWKLMAFERATGKALWETTAHEGTPHMDRHPVSSYANSTPATDGRYVVALFGTDILVCFDASGKVLWRQAVDQTSVPPRSGHFGSSPVIVDDLVIHLNDRDKDSYVAAYRLQDGQEVWRVARDEGQAQSTPALAWTDGPGGRRPLLVVAGPKSVRALEPQTGKEVWSLVSDFQFSVATPVVAGDLVITGGWGKGKPVYAIRTGASGSISPGEAASKTSPLAWKAERGGPEIPTPLVADGLMYVLSGNGVVTALDVRDGRQVYQHRAGRGDFYASPVLSNGRIYIMNTEGEVTVLRAGPSFEVLATNTLNESTSATPAIIDGTMYVRTAESLVALRESAPASK